jgi:hypothetical protein
MRSGTDKRKTDAAIRDLQLAVAKFERRIAKERDGGGGEAL